MANNNDDYEDIFDFSATHASMSPQSTRRAASSPVHRRNRRSRSPVTSRAASSPVNRRSRSPVTGRAASSPVNRRLRSPVTGRAASSPVNRRSPATRRAVSSVRRSPVPGRAVSSVRRSPVPGRAASSVRRSPVRGRAASSVRRSPVRQAANSPMGRAASSPMGRAARPSSPFMLQRIAPSRPVRKTALSVANKCRLVREFRPERSVIDRVPVVNSDINTFLAMVQPFQVIVFDFDSTLSSKHITNTEEATRILAGSLSDEAFLQLFPLTNTLASLFVTLTQAGKRLAIASFSDAGDNGGPELILRCLQRIFDLAGIDGSGCSFVIAAWFARSKEQHFECIAKHYSSNRLFIIDDDEKHVRLARSMGYGAAHVVLPGELFQTQT